MLKRPPILVLLMLVILGLAGCGSSAAEDRYNSGMEKIKGNDADGALTDFNEAIRLDPNLAVAYVYRGAIFVDKKEYAKAIEDENMALKLGLAEEEHEAKAHLARGLAYVLPPNVTKDDARKALDDFEKVIRIKVDYGEAYIGQGLAYIVLDEMSSARASFNLAQELSADPKVRNRAYLLLQTLPSEDDDTPSPSDEPTPTP